MTILTEDYPRGSEWRQWDLHVHSPASFHWQGEKFSSTRDKPRDLALVDEMIGALNAAEPAVFALMDYFCFDGWFALKRRLAQPDTPLLTKMIFPGIELRLAAPMRARLNAHVIFSDQTTDQHLRDFLSRLRLELTNAPLSRDALIEYARTVDADKLKTCGADKGKVMAEEPVAYEAGCKVAELSRESYIEAVEAAPKGMAVGFMPFNTSDGLATLDHLKHYAFAMSLFDCSTIFEARDDPTWNAFVGRKTAGNSNFFAAFQQALKNIPRLPVSGSDAHRFVGTGQDQRGYGNYPSGRATWIKADPTWLGLLQAIKEPAKRCFIGAKPPKLRHIAENRSFFMESVTIAKVPKSNLKDRWFEGTALRLNPDLVAIIGNKGSGKSALADVIALLGNSQERRYFSFLKADRFRGKSGEPARQFVGQLNWCAGELNEANLADDPSPDRVELVRYIPQGRFEALCNEHVAGRSEAFERELRGVVFSHIPEDARGEALTFDQLIEAQEKVFRAKLGDARKELGELNRRIVGLEQQLHPDIRQNLDEQLRLKLVQLENLRASRPAEVARPSDDLSVEQQAAAAELTGLANTELELVQREQAVRERLTKASASKNAAREVTERLDLLDAQVAAATRELALPLATLGLTPEDVLTLTIDRTLVQKATDDANGEIDAINLETKAIAAQRDEIRKKSQVASAALNDPQLQYQAYQTALKEWEARLAAIVGSDTNPDTQKGLERRLQQIADIPKLLEERKTERRVLSEKIFGILSGQRDARTELFAPLQQVIADNQLIREEYKLQFKATLLAFADAISETLFSIVKQNVGDIRGDDESRQAVKTLVDRNNLDSAPGALKFIDDLSDLLDKAARHISPKSAGIEPLMRKDRQPAEAYDYIYGLEYLEPKYTLLFQNTPIEQLSPGQRGALLLIFYLLVDKGRNPIILDQPEENLDNETIVSLLVPVLSEAKQHRQIVMVTHNPNLAVVCDAEQIVYAEFDRKAKSTIRYVSGSIENSTLNTHAVNVLEGTKQAFDNRGGKYHPTDGNG